MKSALPIVAVLALVACAQTGAPGSAPAAAVDPGCATMLAEGDALARAGQKQQAYDVYQRTRDRCMGLHEVRRRLFEVRHPPRPAGEPPPLSVEGAVKVELDLQLPDDVNLAWYAAYWDGQLLREGRGSAKLDTGAHDIDVELYLESEPPGASGGPLRVDLRQQVVVARALAGQKGISGGARVQLGHHGGAGPLATRLDTTITATPFAASAPYAPPAEKIVMLAPSTPRRLSDISKRPHRPLFPRAMVDRGIAILWGLYKVCVDTSGAVTQVTTMKPAYELGPVDPQWKAAIRTWRYQPYAIDGQPVAFCTPVRVQVSAPGRD